VSDRTSVLAKASIALLVIPLLTFVIVVATHLVMLVLSTVVLLASGPLDPGTHLTLGTFLASPGLWIGLAIAAALLAAAVRLRRTRG
jgi:uncharacterized membrane protein YbhN (UPF0104 family)